MKKTNQGITLVALVITIIILLILAGITISQLTGSGLFENAKLAEQKSKNAQEKEDGILSDYENEIGKYVDGTRDDDLKAQIEQLKSTVATLQTQVQELQSPSYPVLYENQNGWTSGSITIEGIQEWEEIGIYVAVNDTPTSEPQLMARLTKFTNGNFLGGIIAGSYVSTTDFGIVAWGVNLVNSGENSLTYGANNKIRIKNSGNVTNANSYNRPIYKIVGIRK